MQINCVYSVYIVVYKGGGNVQTEVYTVGKIEDNKEQYYVIRSANGSIMALETKYLVHCVRANKSPNTIKRAAYSISYFLNYLQENGQVITDIYDLKFAEQHEVFTSFLAFLKASKHKVKNKKSPSNNTCNTYLSDVFGLYGFLELECEQFGKLKITTETTMSVVNSVGVRKNVVTKSFRGYLQRNDRQVESIEKGKILTLLESCSNCRDQLLLLLIAETGFRIGEILGISYTQDIIYEKRLIKVQYREDNVNGARAKYAEYRSALISLETYEFLLYYMSEYRELLKGTDYLFVKLTGKTAGQALNVTAVYAFLRRLESKTSTKTTPHQIRRYFARERRREGWDLLLIKEVLGHKHIQTTIAYLGEQDDQILAASEEYYRKNKSIFMVDQLL